MRQAKAFHLVGAGSEMAVEKAQGRLLEEERDAHAAFVPKLVGDALHRCVCVCV